MNTVSPDAHAEAYESSGASPPAWPFGWTFERYFSYKLWWAESASEVAAPLRRASTDELAIGMRMMRERKGWPLAEEVASCL